jgi:hypothetical protein
MYDPMEGDFQLFAYGSLLYDPELPEELVCMTPARLVGWERSFNKRSVRRGCERDESFAAFGTDEEFFRRGRYHSLVLGTVESAGGWIDGALLSYPAAAGLEVLRRMDRREGFDDGRPPIENDYNRLRVTVTTLDPDKDCIAAWVYHANSDPSAPFAVDPGMSLAERAATLINATPRAMSTESDSRGLGYLEQVRMWLWLNGIVDPAAERLVAAVYNLPGPWLERISPPKKAERSL